MSEGRAPPSAPSTAAVSLSSPHRYVITRVACCTTGPFDSTLISNRSITESGKGAVRWSERELLSTAGTSRGSEGAREGVAKRRVVLAPSPSVLTTASAPSLPATILFKPNPAPSSTTRSPARGREAAAVLADSAGWATPTDRPHGRADADADADIDADADVASPAAASSAARICSAMRSACMSRKGGHHPRVPL